MTTTPEVKETSPTAQMQEYSLELKREWAPKAFKLQMVAQTPATTVASSSYYLGPLDQISSI